MSEKAEYTSDRILIHLVRLQHIFEQIDHLSVDPNVPIAGYTNHFTDTDSFLHMFQTLHTQLQDYTAQFSPQLTSNNFLLATQMHTINLYLCQVSLFEKETLAQLPWAFKIKMLCHGLTLARSSFEALANVPLNTERYMSYTEWLQTGFCLILSCKLTLMVASDKSIRQTEPQVQALCDNLDMVSVLDACIARQAAQQAEMKTGFDYTGWLTWIQEWFEKHYYAYSPRSQGGYTPRENGRAGHAGHAAAVERGMVPPVPAAAATGATTTHQPPPSHSHSMQFTTSDEMGIPVAADDVIPWAGFPDMLPSDNVLGGWMDLGVFSI